MGGEVKAGWDKFVSASVFAEGNVVEASGSLILSHGSRYQGYGFRLSAGKVVIGVRFKELGIWEQNWSHTLFDGWTLVDINK